MTISNYYNETKHFKQCAYFSFEEYAFSKNAKGIAMIIHGATLIMKNLRTKLQFENKKN